MKIGMIGLDTSHVEIFTKLLHEGTYNFGEAQVTIGCPHPSLDLDLSRTRVQGYTELLRDTYGVKITDSVEEVAHEADTIMITAVDGRKHLELFKQVVAFGKPVFIDKPITLSVGDTEEVFSLSQKFNTPVMSSSSLRYADSVTKLLAERDEKPTGVYLSGPLPFIEKMPHYFWYGIHMIELLFTVMGPDYRRVEVQGNETYDVITTEWQDGRFGVIRGNHEWHGNFEAVIHYPNESVHLPIYQDQKPYYAGLLEKVIQFFQTGISPVPAEETLAIIKFIEEAGQ
ncbi:Gfo/Idh/MocA family oxidoreductase [Bacillus carboniphilus]|uniref:Gfo/Idh/MocA family oxidoreductase n=1 Tax=Bacillus carboniphilus TaxID=86663 RepID=A0ABN0VTX9_9BACI